MAVRLFVIALCLAVLVLAACKPRQAIVGEAAVPGVESLPDGAVFEADLVDLSTKNERGRVVASVTVEKPAAGRIPFTIEFAKAAIIATRRYGVEARVTLEGRPIFATIAPRPVLGQAGETNVALVLQPVTSAADIRPLEEAVRAIERREETYQRREGELTLEQGTGSFVAYFDKGALVLVKEGRDFGPNGSAAVAYHFKSGALLMYTEDALLRQDSPRGGTDVVAIKLYFKDGRFVSGTKSINGAVSVPSQADIAEAMANAEAMKKRAMAKRNDASAH